MNDVVTLLLDNAAAVTGRVIVGTLLFGVIGLGVVGIAFAKRDWVKVGAPFDPWPGRLSIALWIIVAIPAFALAGGIVGLGFGAGAVIERNHVTERITHSAVQVVVDELLKDETARGYVVDHWIAIDDIAKLVERAPQALGDVTHESTRDAVRAVAGDAGFVELSGKIAAGIARWLAKSQAEDRLQIVKPIVEQVAARDVDKDGKVAVSDVIDAGVRIHLEPRAAGFARDLVMGQAAVPGAVAFGVVLAPMAVCTVVRRRRAQPSGA